MKYFLSIQIGDADVPLILNEDFDKIKKESPLVYPNYRNKSKWEIVEYIQDTTLRDHKVFLYRFANKYYSGSYIAYIEELELQVSADSLIVLADRLLKEIDLYRK